MTHTQNENEEQEPARDLLIDEIDFPRYKLKFVVDHATGALCSREYDGYRIADEQILPGNRLPGFQQYLLLEPIPQKTTEITTAAPITKDALCVLIPHRKYVSISRSGSVGVTDSSRVAMGLAPLVSCAELGKTNTVSVGNGLDFVEHRLFRYSIERSGAPIKSHSVEARLHLAALYMATTSPIPDKAVGCCGHEVAVGLVRECFLNRPLTERELQKLEMLFQLVKRDMANGGTSNPSSSSIEAASLASLHCLVLHLGASAWRLAFCHYPDAFGHSAEIRAPANLKKFVRAQEQALSNLMRGNALANHKHLNMLAQTAMGDLFPAEEFGLFGCVSRRRERSSKLEEAVLTLDLHGMDKCHVTKNIVNELEQELKGFAQEDKKKSRFKDARVLAEVQSEVLVKLRDVMSHSETMKSKVGENMTSSLQNSLHEFERHEEHALKPEFRKKPQSLLDHIVDLQSRAQGDSDRSFTYIYDTLDTFPDHEIFEKATGVRASDRARAWIFGLMRDLHRQRIGLLFASARDENGGGDSSHSPEQQESFVASLCEMVLDKGLIRRVNPFLQTDVVREVHDAIFLFLELRVFLEKMRRLRTQIEVG